MFQINIFLRQKKLVSECSRRYKHKINHWSLQRKKKPASVKALEHFDEFYEEKFKDHWALIRNGLLGKPKYVAVINNYSDSEASIKFLQQKGALNVHTLFDLEKGHISEEITKKKRQESLENAWKADAVDQGLPEDININQSKFSLDESLKTAEYDKSRLIDGINATSVMYEFVPATKLQHREDFIPENQYDETYKCSDSFMESTVKEYSIHFPAYLNVFCFEEENVNDFPSPRRGSTQVLNYYLMDGGSILPVLALDLRPGSRLLDMCAAPGGKSVVALQTLYPAQVKCNDLSNSRVSRIQSVMDQYFYDLEERWLRTGKIVISQGDARYLHDEDFDRVLVDVPCTTDRRSVREDDNNIFRPDRVKERLQLPELQTELLMQALRIVEIGGIVVYSTCTLSPIQNEGVVHIALKKLWEETTIRAEVIDLSPALRQFRNVFKFCNQKYMKYGHLVLPHVAQNYGPTYFCKLRRIK